MALKKYILPLAGGGAGQDRVYVEDAGYDDTAMRKLITPASGISGVGIWYRQWGYVAQLEVRFVINRAIEVPHNGNIENIEIGTLAANITPIGRIHLTFDGDNCRGGWGNIRGGQVFLGGINASGNNTSGTQYTIAANSEWRCTAVYLLNNVSRAPSLY